MFRINYNTQSILCHAIMLTLLVMLCDVSLFAQSSSSKKKSKKSKSSKNQLSQEDLRTMDLQADKVKEEFVKGMVTLATDYAKGGEYEKSKAILRQLREITPRMPGVREKLQQLDEALLSENEVEFDFKITSGWGTPQAYVVKGKKFRIQVGGTYKFVSNALLSPAGFEISKPPKLGMIADIPCGALMGVIVDKEGKKGKKISKPFLIGSGQEMSPIKSGTLFLKVNTPLGSKCSGRLKVKLSGAISRAGK